MSAETEEVTYFSIPKRAVVLSLILHGSVIFFAVGIRILEHFNIHLFGKKPIIEVYQEFIQVDVVALPDIQIKDLEKIDVTQDVVDNPETGKETQKASTQDQMLISDAEAKKKAEEKKQAEAKQAELEKEKALKKLQDEAKRESILKDLAKKKEKEGRKQLKGNLTSQGTSASGKVGTNLDKYRAMVMQKIKDNFNVFSWQKRKDLEAVVYLELFPTGRIREKRLMQKSLDPLYDSAVLEAIEQAQPLPVPEDLSVLSHGFTVRFRPEE